MTMTPPPPSDHPDDPAAEMAGEGHARRGRFSQAQKRAFLLQRALSGSPLFLGGDLTTLPPDDLALLTHPEVLACNRHARPARPLIRLSDIDVWIAEDTRQPGCGWLGVFNHNPSLQEEQPRLQPRHLQLPPETRIHDAWENLSLGRLENLPPVRLPSEDCAFLRYAS
jgi:hypothetical protein